MIHSQEYAQLLLEITKLRQIVAEQKEQIAALLKENQELKEKLGTNSSNSSKPPSQDPNRTSRRSNPTGGKLGGQPGHAGHKRTLYPPEKVSKTIEVRPEVCPKCGAINFEQIPVAIEIRQVIDLPEISPEITLYNIHTCKCPCCWKHVRGDVPKEAERGFGPRLMGFVTMLTGEGHLTKRKICSIAAHLGLKISLGALCNIHIFGLWDAFKKGAFPRPILQEKANEHVENIRAVLAFTVREAKNSKSIALAHDLLNRFSMLWTFLFIEGIEPTNNLAERGLRPTVIFRKLSGGNQSDWGARFIERLMTVVCTLKQNAMNTFTFLTEVFAAHQMARPPPILTL